ncbi:MAG: response regulator, partial [Desulfamplus sp.]|nr:response regulator [Desulfamplus sp.]
FDFVGTLPNKIKFENIFAFSLDCKVELIHDLLKHQFIPLLDGMDLVMLDYYLGKETALDIVKQLRESNNSIPIIVLTGNEDVHTAAKISRDGADDYLVKGQLDISQLRRSICNVMERYYLRREINELKEQMHALQRLEAMGSLAGGIAHDFNNILFPITGYAEMLLIDAKNESLKKGLKEILKGAERAKELIRQILNFSRQSGQPVRPLRVHLVVNEVLKLMRATLPSTIQVRSSIDKENDLVMADSTQIHQIIMNLMTNAYHATQNNGGEIFISLKSEKITGALPDGQEVIHGNYVHLCVRDTGEGISKDVMKRVFDPYFTTKPEGKGTGLGLAVVLGIVKSSHGYISLESEIGKGTSIHIYFPLLEKEINNVKFLHEERQVYKGSGHILLVDDDPAIIRMEKLMLERMGYHITTMTSSREALELFMKTPDKFDLVLTDFTMPGMTGEQMACAMISIRSDIPVVLCTGFSENITEKKALEMGIRALLMKPVVQSDLSLTLHKILYHENAP